MKNVIKILSFISLILIITLASCGGGGGGNSVKGGTIPVKIRAYNNKGVTPSKSVVLSRSAAEAGGISRAVQTDFSEYTNIYNNLGNKQGSGITPTKFIFCIDIFAYTSVGECFLLGYGFLDLASGKTITLDYGIPTDVTIAAIEFDMGTDGVLGEDGRVAKTSYVEFDWPFYTGTNDNNGRKINFEASPYYTYIKTYTSSPSESLGDKNFYNFNPSIINGKATIQRYFLDPAFANDISGYDKPNDRSVGRISYIIYGGNSRKLYAYQNVPISDIIPGVNSIKNPVYPDYPGVFGYGGYEFTNIVVPFSPITIPSNASSVTFEVSWDLENIIQPYKTSHNMETVVLKNGFWESLYINVKID
jgi:hypothetical protein